MFASIDNTEDFNYNILVENHGTGVTTGVTTVVNNLPSPVVLRATPTGNGWTCTGAVGTSNFTCTSNSVIPAGQLYSVITVPVRVTGITYFAG